MEQTLDEAAREYMEKHVSRNENASFSAAFMAGAEWQKRQRIELIVSTLKNSVLTMSNFEKKNKLPDIIFLQFHGDSECVDNIEEISLEDATWSEERIYPTDVEYTRRKSPWISINERLPKEYGYYIVTDGEIVFVAYFFKHLSKFARKEYPHLPYDDGVVKLYMPIPSFDDILEANRDVLERIKENGD